MCRRINGIRQKRMGAIMTPSVCRNLEDGLHRGRQCVPAARSEHRRKRTAPWRAKSRIPPTPVPRCGCARTHHMKERRSTCKIHAVGETNAAADCRCHERTPRCGERNDGPSSWKDRGVTHVSRQGRSPQRHNSGHNRRGTPSQQSCIPTRQTAIIPAAKATVPDGGMLLAAWQTMGNHFDEIIIVLVIIFFLAGKLPR